VRVRERATGLKRLLDAIGVDRLVVHLDGDDAVAGRRPRAIQRGARPVADYGP
jgi:hypothetical protein